MEHRREIWVTGGMMAALGALLGLRQAGALLSVLAGDAGAFSGLPTPRALDWIAAQAPAERWLSARDPLVMLAAVGLALALAWRLARRLNPHGTVVASSTAGTDPPRPRLQTPLEPALIRRGAIMSAVTFYLLGGLRPWVESNPFMAAPVTWGLSGLAFLAPQRPWLGLGAAFLLGGAALWLLWGEWGAITPRQAPDGSRWSALIRGALAGAAAFPVLFPLSLWGRGLLGSILAAAGLADPGPWRLALAGMVLGLPVAFLCLGLLGHTLARPGGVTPAIARWAAALLVLFAVGEARFITVVAVGRYDDGRDMAALVSASRRPSSARALLIFPPLPATEPLPGFLPLLSIQQIDAGHGSAGRTWQYLRRRHYQSIPTADAFVHLHDCASLQWDSAESLRVDLANLERNPQPIFARLLLQKLFTCAPSPANRALLDQAAEPARFRSDRGWLSVLGALYHRFGDPTTAAGFLRRASPSPTEQRKAPASGAPLTTGSIAGRLMVNGHPGAGLMVGILPERSWQALVGAPHPFELRWVAAAATTGADGRFRLCDLGEESSALVVMGDPDHLPVRSRTNHADRPPGRLHLDRAHPTRDLGTIRIVTGGAPAAG
jgi:hypothetical protein